MVTSLGNLKGHKGVCFIQPDAVLMLARIRGCEIITRFLPIKLTAEMIHILTSEQVMALRRKVKKGLMNKVRALKKS